MGARHRIAILLLLAAGCTDNTGATLEPDRFEPGLGAWVKGVHLAVGAPLPPAPEALGAPEPLRDLGPAGVRVRYPDVGLAVTLTGTSLQDTVRSLALTAGFGGKVDTLGLGSTRSDVQAAFGAPTVDPLLGAWLYPAKGLTFRFDADAVSEILVEAAR